MAAASGLSIAAMKRANEVHFRAEAELDAGLARLWQVMNACIERGMAGDGILPGGLKVRRRAKAIHQALLAERGLNLTAPHVINDWMIALRDGGERRKRRRRAGRDRADQWRRRGAAGGASATGSTMCRAPRPARIGEFLLTAAAIGGLVKHNASISGAECGCQAEVGSPPPRWPRPGWPRSWAARPNRWKTPPRSRWSITSA